MVSWSLNSPVRGCMVSRRLNSPVSSQPLDDLNQEHGCIKQACHIHYLQACSALDGISPLVHFDLNSVWITKTQYLLVQFLT